MYVYLFALSFIFVLYFEANITREVERKLLLCSLYFVFNQLINYIKYEVRKFVFPAAFYYTIKLFIWILVGNN